MGEAKITSNLYPLFESGRVVKKELLRSLRNYSFGCVGLSFSHIFGTGLGKSRRKRHKAAERSLSRCVK